METLIKISRPVDLDLVLILEVENPKKVEGPALDLTVGSITAEGSTGEILDQRMIVITTTAVERVAAEADLEREAEEVMIRTTITITQHAQVKMQRLLLVVKIKQRKL